MASFRSGRIEALLGSTVADATEANVTGLVTAGAVEDFDLDFKAQLYGNGDSDKRALAGDVAALANTAGGLIIIGIAEDEHARAASAPGVALSDDETRRMTQILATISPLPTFEIRAIPSAADPNHGFYLLAVSRSPRAPHAVPVNDGLRYPKRNGSTIRYLAEPEVAEAYRERAFGSRNQTDRLDEIMRDILARLDTSEHPWVAVALMPELPGDLVIDTAGLNTIQSQLGGRPPVLIQHSHYMQVSVGRRRYLLGGGQNQSAEKYVATDLHTDGGGAFAAQLGDLRGNQQPPPDETAPMLISDEGVTETVLSGLLSLGQHARDRAGAGGSVLVHATVVPASTRAVEIGHNRMYGFGDSRSKTAWAEGPVPAAEASALLDDIAAPGVPLLQTARVLADQIGQVFGIAEMKQIGPDGAIQIRYWKGADKSPIAAWAKANNLPMSTAT
jgi:hypothetical protein